MPSGSTHRAATLALLPLATLAAGALEYRYTNLEGAAITGVVVGCGVLATLLINPDLDLVETYIHHKFRKNPFSLPWYALWWPYGKAVPHRHWFSHLPVIGTVFRLFYILAVAAAILACVYTQAPTFAYDLNFDIPRTYVLWFVAGMVISDALHYFMDVSVSKYNRIT